MRYNVGLMIAGLLAFIAYAILGSTLLSEDVDFEITLFTTAFQCVGYLLMMGVANVCYFLGPISERFVRPADPQSYRINCFRLGFWFSVLLPFTIPVLVVLSALFRWRHEP